MLISCKPPSEGNNNNTNTNTPDTTPEPPSIKINITDSNLAKVSGDTILLKLSAFGETITADTTNHFSRILAISTKKAFEIVHSHASEGLLLVGKGNVTSAGAITTLAVGAFANTAADNDGIHIVSGGVTAAGGIPAGLNFFGVFANKTAPTTIAEAATDAEPFAFTSTGTGIFDAQPLFYCVATAPAITASVAVTDRLTGAHKADCLVSGTGTNFGGTSSVTINTRNSWWGKPDPFKREIQVAVVAIKTDGKTIGDIMPGANATAKLANFNDGISTTDMAAIITAVGSDNVLFKTFKIKIVRDADF